MTFCKSSDCIMSIGFVSFKTVCILYIREPPKLIDNAMHKLCLFSSSISIRFFFLDGNKAVEFNDLTHKCIEKPINENWKYTDLDTDANNYFYKIRHMFKIPISKKKCTEIMIKQYSTMLPIKRLKMKRLRRKRA